MNKENTICPFCGRTDYFTVLKNESFHGIIELEEEIANYNFSENINNNSFCLDSKLNYLIKETRNTNNYSYNSTYCEDNFNFSLISSKSSGIINKEQIIKQKKQKLNKTLEDNKKLGRKKKREAITTFDGVNMDKIKELKLKTHDKYTPDNIRKKCKNIIIKSLSTFINDKIKVLYKNDLGYGDLEKSLKLLKDDKKADNGYFCEFVNKKLKDIFSQEISSRFCNYSSDHNKKVIESLVNEGDEEKRNYFNNLFNITFMDCLKYFREEKEIKEIEELKGLERLSSVKEKLLKENEENYVNYFVYFIENFEKFINSKKKKFKK